MDFDWEDVIAAPAVPPQGGMRGIVRLSGAETAAVLRRAGMRAVGGEALRTRPRHPAWQAVELTLAEGLALTGDLLVWPDERSFTGQPAAEFHTLGSPPLVQAALGRFVAAGARPARPGEFTLRAFLAGRTDLTQAEAVLGVIHARDERELETALSQLAGGLRARIERLRSELLDVLAHLEAGLDFVEEEDVRFVTTGELTRALAAAAEAVDALLAASRGRTLVESLPRVVLHGPPNAGKSSLFNALLRRFGSDTTAAALVSPVPGTTRDYLVGRLRHGSREFLLVDTAGDETPLDPISAAAQSGRREQVEQAALVLECAAADAAPLPPAPATPDVSTTIRPPSDPPTLLVRTKCDGPEEETSPASGPLETSALTGRGLDRLATEITTRLELTTAAAEAPAFTAATAVRCRENLVTAAASLAAAQAAVRAGVGEELIAADLRGALDGLGLIVGTVCTDDLLDRIFSRFCIGK